MIESYELDEEVRYEDEKWMRLAIEEATQAGEKGEVPIGAVIVKDGQLIARGHNIRELAQDALGHAEVQAIRQANQFLGAWRLEGSTMYVTLEPCPMCSGALINARVDRLVYGANDLKAGTAGTLMNLLEDNRFNHRLEVVRGVLQEECANLLTSFFKELRLRKKNKDLSTDELG